MSTSDMGKPAKNKKKGDKNGSKLPDLKPGSYHYYGTGGGSTTVNNNKHHESLNATDDDSLEELFKPGQQTPTVEAYSLRLGHQRMNAAYDKFLGENNVKAGIDLFARVKDEGFMEAVTWSSCYIIRASLTLEKADIDKARECVHHAGKMCKKLMKSSFFENISKLVVTPNYDKYTDVEVFAQLYYAKQFALRIALDAMETNSVFTLIKLAYYLRGLVRTYNEVWQIKKKRTAWESEEARMYFYAHARFANGIINLVISHTPPKFLRIMNFLGYQGTESVGLNELNRVAFEMPAGFTSKMSQLLLIYYWVYAKPHGENIPDDLSLCKQLVEAELKLFPQSMLYGLAKAKIAQINGNFDEAIVTLNGLLKAPHLKSAYKAFYFELIWCHAVNLDWDACIECSERIRSSKHSPVCTAFLSAVFRYVKGVESGDQAMLDQATKEFEIIPSLRIRHFGKTMTTEKAALTTSILYFKKGKKLVLPVMAMLYTGNYLMFIRSEEMLAKLEKRVESQVTLYSVDYESETACLDDYLVAIFYKAVLLRLRKKYAEAVECHEIIFKEKSRIELEQSILPMSTMELGLIEIEKGNFEEAKALLESAEKDFSGYLAENFVHLKVYAAYRRMGHNTDKQQEDKERLNKHILNWLKYHEIDLKSYREIISTTTK